jgi:hypothetical protein
MADKAVRDDRVCLDGVEYFMYAHALTPHLEPSGKPFTCAASAGEAGTATTTKIGVVHEHATREAGDAQ